MAVAALLATAQNKPYITRVLEYCPAPGQFINVAPAYTAGEPVDSVLARVMQLIGPEFKPERTVTFMGQTYHEPADTIAISERLISLGAYGGYVTFGFDHPVVNVPDALDLQIAGNAFSGSCEPGIVLVSRDLNGNGLPDDPWYELAGSEYYKETTQHDYQITYYRTPADHKPTKLDKWIVDTTYIRWTSNDMFGATAGYIDKNNFHKQDYWPLWTDAETLSFAGTKLPNNVNNQGGSGDDALFWQDYYEWGYVDNRPDYLYNEPMTDSIATNCNLGFDIEWAVDSDGKPVHLSQIDFVKVHTAMNQKGGWIGETSTEVSGAIDLHPDAEPLDEELTGDVNGDSVLSGADVTALYGFLLDGLKPGGNPDVNRDNIVSGADITALYSILLAQ